MNKKIDFIDYLSSVIILFVFSFCVRCLFDIINILPIQDYDSEVIVVYIAIAICFLMPIVGYLIELIVKDVHRARMLAKKRRNKKNE